MIYLTFYLAVLVVKFHVNDTTFDRTIFIINETIKNC